MQKVALFYNPAAGRHMERRRQVIEEAASILRTHGKEVFVDATRGPGTAAGQVREVLGRGHDTVIIAGGDGTINDAIQGLAGTNAALGVIPMGTGNVLAHDLGIAHKPSQAVRQLLRFEPRRIALGRIEFTGHEGDRASRWFIAVAGVGGSAKLMYDVHAGLKGRHGMIAYYFQMARLALLHRFPSFTVEYCTPEGETKRLSAAEADAVRITNFGGLMRRWAWGAQLQRSDAQLVVFTTSSRSRFLHFTFGRILGTTWRTPGVEMAYAKEITCTAADPEQKLYAEADGEYIGGPPVKIQIVPDQLNLLMNPKV